MTGRGITNLLKGEGIRAIAVVTDEPERYPTNPGFAEGVTIRHRRELDAVQRRFAATTVVTALIRNKVCAKEKRRRRDRGRRAAGSRWRRGRLASAPRAFARGC